MKEKKVQTVVPTRVILESDRGKDQITVEVDSESGVTHVYWIKGRLKRSERRT